MQGVSRGSPTAVSPCVLNTPRPPLSERNPSAAHLGVAIEARVRERVVGLKGGEDGCVVEEIRCLVEEDPGARARV